MKELEPPTEFPEILANVWFAFVRLGNTRTQGFSGPNPISFRDIRDYIELTGTPLEPRDIDTLLSLDSAYLRNSQ